MKAPIKWTKMKQIKSPFERSFSLYLNPPIDRTIHVRVPIYICPVYSNYSYRPEQDLGLGLGLDVLASLGLGLA